MTGNRFKKSVDAATSNTLDSIQETALDNVIYNIKDNILDNALDNTLDNTTYNMLSNIKDNILDEVISKGKKARGGNHTFYLSADVSDALARFSKKTKQSKSNIVNDILRAVLADGISK